MNGKYVRMVWGIVYLLGLAATQFLIADGTIQPDMAMLAWLVLLVVSNFSIGKSYGKKMTPSSDMAWKGGTVLFVVLSAMLWLGWLPGAGLAMFALYFLYTGMGTLVSGWDLKNSMWIGMGFIMLVYAIVLPIWFPGDYYLFAAVVLGIPMLLESLMAKK